MLGYRMVGLFRVRLRSEDSMAKSGKLTVELKRMGATRVKDSEWVLRTDTEIAELRSKLSRLTTDDGLAVEPISRGIYRNILYNWQQRIKKQKRAASADNQRISG
jgi:hypothetical protein